MQLNQTETVDGESDGLGFGLDKLFAVGDKALVRINFKIFIGAKLGWIFLTYGEIIALT